MSLYERDYSRPNFEHAGSYRVRLGPPALTPVVKYLLIINVAVFFIETFFFSAKSGPINTLEKVFAVYPLTLVHVLQLWRVVTYQFLHAGLGHVFVNMLGLFFFGPILEGRWGSKRFLTFYLVCGAVGGVLYPLFVLLGHIKYVLPMVGASGAIFGIIAAVTVMFPQMQVYVYAIFPIRLYVLSIILVIVNLLSIWNGDNVGGALAHLGGMAAGAGYVLYGPLMAKSRLKFAKGRWEMKMQQERILQAELDRILEKVHTSGLNSLTNKEKKTLQHATQRQKQRQQ